MLELMSLVAYGILYAIFPVLMIYVTFRNGGITK